MGILDGSLAASIYAGFKGKLSAGVLRRAAPAESGGLDSRGDPISVAPVTWALEGFADAYSAFYKRGAGIPDDDLKVCVFGASLPAGVIPQKDDQVKLVRAGVARWYQIRKTDIDPAGALWVCQSFSIAEPV